MNPEKWLPDYEALKALSHVPFSKNNNVDLLIDGEATFESIFDGIEQAEKYILFQFYIVRDDHLGRRVKERLIQKAHEGIRVYFLYDEIGSHTLPSTYAQDLRDGGVEVSTFNTTQGFRNRFQINFRNHRKIVVVDGKVAWTGGINIGDEYLGHHKKLTPWRDTHVRIQGPAVAGAQSSFIRDWLWAARSLIDVDWVADAAPDGDALVMFVASSPSDDLPTTQLLFVHALNAAKERIWIASPYFVPDTAVIAALQLAALRGVDVRVMLPLIYDRLHVKLSSLWFIEKLEHVGVRFYEFEQGFLHQKVMLIDHGIATVGTANFDNRSFRLNFEVLAVVIDEDFASEVESMLNHDFDRCHVLTADDIRKKPIWTRIAIRIARLLAPIQ